MGTGAEDVLPALPLDCINGRALLALDNHSAGVLHPEAIDILCRVGVDGSSHLLFWGDSSAAGRMACALATRAGGRLFIHVGHIPCAMDRKPQKHIFVVGASALVFSAL